MTKREMVRWLEDKRDQVTNDRIKEIEQKEKELYKTILEPLGFYEVAKQIQEHLRRAMNIWRTWKAAQNTEAIKLPDFCYRGLEYSVNQLADTESDLSEYMVGYDIQLADNLYDKLKRERNETMHKIRSNYNKVINVVDTSKNVKEAAAYLEKLGFELSDFGKEIKPSANEPEVDTSFLFLKKAA